MNRLFVGLGSLFAFLAVICGAFGTHGLRGHISESAMQTWQTAAHYHLIHAVALVLVGVLGAHLPEKPIKVAGWLFVVGMVVFGGTLYVLAATGIRWLGAITPLGGVSLLAGWLALAIAALKK